MIEDNISWLKNLPSNVASFLENQRSENLDGYYSYSESGDLYPDSIKWNVGSSCYALKILYTLGVEDKDKIEPLINYILTFKKDNSMIYDDMIVKRSFVRNFLSSVKNKRFENLLHQNYKRAETRQCLSALDLYNAIPSEINIVCPTSEQQIDSFLSSLNWNLPWAAGSHLSHLLFFLSKKHKLEQISKENYSDLVAFTLKWIKKYELSNTGGWGTTLTDERGIINGSMKVITGLQNVGVTDYSNSKKLIDTCLQYYEKGHACDNFNIVYVLNKLNNSLNSSYRHEEICNFMMEKLSVYQDHYKPSSGGFSFNRDSSNINYYGLNITKGKNEADIHGTVLFLWGACLIADTLEMNLGLREFIA
ncbi:hypothetical protein L2593_001573 [Vibrio vulnificus]|uniref:hypothetical protein n=1 Tax=Vibrio vulnificus TaxID=672 RepID=UPI00165E9426|nr:hypothetical protein [Vibrio vulnificus]EIT7026114.1 hypothetical protein [Vibrio vulnificus]